MDAYLAQYLSCSRKHSRILGKKLKLLTNTLPTTDILHRNYPELITQTMQCFLCNSASESNDHFWACPVVYNNLRNVTLEFRRHLTFNIVQDTGIDSSTVLHFLDSTVFFNWAISGRSSLDPLPPRDSTLIAIFTHFYKSKSNFQVIY